MAPGIRDTYRDDGGANVAETLCDGAELGRGKGRRQFSLGIMTEDGQTRLSISNDSGENAKRRISYVIAKCFRCVKLSTQSHV